MTIEYALGKPKRARLTRAWFLLKTSEGGCAGETETELLPHRRRAGKDGRAGLKLIGATELSRGGILLLNWRLYFPAGGNHADLP